jgi:hypothetical protein
MTINFQKIVQGLILPSLASLPTDAVTGDLCNHNNVLKFYNGTSWETLGGGSGMTNPMTTTGDIIYSSDNSGTPARLGIGFEGATLEVVSGIPSWVGGTPPTLHRGIFAGGNGSNSTIDYITITTAANATAFGTLDIARNFCAGFSSSTRGVIGGGSGTTTGTGGITMEYVTIATTGNGTTFGDLTNYRSECAALSNSTRGVMGGGDSGSSYVTMEYVTIATTGNSSSFGNLNTGCADFSGLASPTRGIFSAGSNNHNMDYITIASASNATNFGTMTALFGAMGCASSTRGVWGGGVTTGNINTIEYVDIATTSNPTAFGNLTVSRSYGSGTSDSITGVFAGGYDGSESSLIDYITIATTGNATTFGNLTAARHPTASMSDSHGGL